MPYLQDATDNLQSTAASTWRTALKGALSRRISPEQLKAPLEQLAREHALPGQKIAGVLIAFRADDRNSVDPLLLQYARLLLQAGSVGIADMLLGLLSVKEWGQATSHSGLPTSEEQTFTMLAVEHMQSPNLGPNELQRTTLAITRWLHTASAHESAKQLEAAMMHTPDALTYGKYEALATLTISLFGQQGYRSVSKQTWWKKRRPTIVTEMRNFDVTVLQWMQSSFSGRLQALTKLPPFVETDDKGRPILTQDQILEGIMQEGHVTASQSRAGIFVWLNACLCGRPMTDDVSMLTYLSTRYSANNQALSIDLVHASFDVLTNAILRHDNSHELRCLRSFTCNKLPQLLAILSSFMEEGVMETCLQTALFTVAMDPIAPMEAGSSEATDVLRKTRLEFLQACLLHGFVHEATIGSILQEPSVALPKVVKYTKEGLLAQCNANISAFERLAGELGGMQGNAGAISSCTVELINLLCNNKDTMSLKTACICLIKRIKDIDIVLQHTQPSNLLMPLCILLKDWVHDQDQAEFTPAYEEFASILLFTLSVLHRYRLTASDIGLAGTDNFVFDVLAHVSGGISFADMSQEQSTQLSKWLEGLFAVDEQGETSGIGDEVMRHCPPQAFYALVPTLFEQSVAACKSRSLSMKTLKSGIELLLEPFLLPSLIGGLQWLTSHSWEDHDDADILLQILDKLLKPSTSSADTQAMHKAVMRIVAKPLRESLEDLIRRRPDKTEVQSLITFLGSYADSTSTVTPDRSQVDQWTSLQKSDDSAALRATIRQLVSWAAGSISTPPKYSHRLLLTACLLNGPDNVLRAMAAELKDAPIQNLPTVLDVCTSMICAPTSTPHTVRQSLSLIVSETEGLLDMQAGVATALVRLSNSVEAQLAAQQMTMPFALPQTQADAADQMMQELGLADATAGTNGAATQNANAAPQITDADLEAALGQPLEMSASGVQDMSNAGAGGMHLDQTHDFFADLDMGIDQQQQSQGQPQMLMQGSDLSGNQQNQEDDIFAGLDIDMGNDDFNFG